MDHYSLGLDHQRVSEQGGLGHFPPQFMHSRFRRARSVREPKGPTPPIMMILSAAVASSALVGSALFLALNIAENVAMRLG